MSRSRRALLSVSDKTELIPFAEGLIELSFQLISTGGTAQSLRDAGLPVTKVSEVTGFPEIMEGRVKTLHPAVHAGLLAHPEQDAQILGELGFHPINLLVVNLYPFEATIARNDCTEAQAIENIDVGGPAMIRACAKNHANATVVVDPEDYPSVLSALKEGEVPDALRRRLAAKAFTHTAHYDALIGGYLEVRSGESAGTPDPLVRGWRRRMELRYGENPHQSAAFYAAPGSKPGSIAAAEQLQGKPLSFNNLADADAALSCVGAFAEPACAIVKHANPCGVAVGANPLAAYRNAFRTDPTSAFGGIIAFNRPLDLETASAIMEQQLVDVIIAPEIEAGALDEFQKKKNSRILRTSHQNSGNQRWALKSVEGGVLLQSNDNGSWDSASPRTVTKRSPSENELTALRFAWTVVKFVKSNAIVFSDETRTLGIGAGQTSRVLSVRIAAMKAADEGFDLNGAVMASDAFFPFPDGIDVAAAHGITAVVHPGGSVRDKAVIQAADGHGMSMVFTGMRHFRH